MRDPIVLQLTQGISPDKIALTLAVGFALGMFPVFGCTTLLCMLVAYYMRLNQPIILLLNQALWPVHVSGFLICWKLGQRMFHVPLDEQPILNMKVLYRAFKNNWWETLHSYSVGMFHTIVVWAILVPPAILLVYYATLPIIRSVTRLKTEVAAKKAAAEHPPGI